MTINCFHAAELKNAIKVVTGVDEEIARRIIGASRYGESDSRAGLGVMALFSNPLFSGESYGLALAIADKLVRLQPDHEWSAIYATGVIPADGCGRVQAVQGFVEKIELLRQKAIPGSVFIFPRANMAPNSDRVQMLLNMLKGSGVSCLPIAHIDDLQGRLWAVPQTRQGLQGETGSGPRLLLHPVDIWKGTALFLLAALTVFLLYFAMNTHAPESTEAIQQKTVVVEKKKEKDAVGDQKRFSHQEKKQEGQTTGSSRKTAVANTPGQPRHPARKHLTAGTAIESGWTDPSRY